MTRNLPKILSRTLSKIQYDEDSISTAKSMTSMTIKQRHNDSDLNSEILERGRKRRFRYFVASLGLTVAAVNCYAQATFCIAIVEMVLPADYVFKGESGSQAIKVVPSNQLGTSTNSSHPVNRMITNIGQPIEELESLSCPVEYKYRDYYDEWRFPNYTSDSPLASLLLSQPPTSMPSSHVIDISNRFDWDASRQGLLLGAFAMGMAPLQVLGGRLAEIYGAKWVLFVGCIGTALTNITIPVLAHFSYSLLVVNRVLMGISQAGMEPGLMCLMAQWLAPAETGFFISMLLFALCIGFFLGSLLSSYLLTIGLGWALTYYVTGGLNLIVSLIWFVYASKGPEESHMISEEELAYIKYEQRRERAKAKCQVTDMTANNDLATAIQDISTNPDETRGQFDEQARGHDEAPWMNIMKTPSVWAFIICKISVRWCADVLTIELPTYLANVLHLSIKLNGILNSLSSAFFAIFSFITGYFVNELLKRTHEGVASGQERRPDVAHNDGLVRRKSLMSKTTLRKLFQSVASFGSAIAIFLMTHYDCNIRLSMSMMFVLSACLMMGTGGELQIPYDMTSRYPGTLHGMACTLSVSGWLAPPLIGLILGDQPSSRYRWSIVWYLTATINLLGGLVFVLFADASPRNFDKRTPTKKPEGPGKTLQHNRQNGLRLADAANNNEKSKAAALLPHHRHRHQHQVRSNGATVVDLRYSPAQVDGGRSLARALRLTAPRPLAGTSSCSSTSFDSGELLKIRQPEGSLMPSSSRMDSLLASQLGDRMFPYQPQRQTKKALALLYELELSDISSSK